MALSRLEASTITQGIQIAKRLVEDVYPLLLRLDVVYHGVGNVKNTVTQANLDATPAVSGLTKQELDDGMYAAAATVRAAIGDSYTALVDLASRA